MGGAETMRKDRKTGEAVPEGAAAEEVVSGKAAAGEAAPGEEQLWALLLSHQGESFHTAKNLEFTYTIRGGEMFVDRRSKSITRATISKAFRRVREDSDHEIRGPKALNCFGAPYVWAIFSALGLVVMDGSKPARRKKRTAEEAGRKKQEEDVSC